MAFDPLNNPVDKVELAGKLSPGIATIKNASSLREWKVREPFGVTGGFTRFIRRKLAQPVLELRLYNDQDWADWHAWKPIVMALPRVRVGGNNPASGYLKIDHPILADLEIKSVGVVDVSQPEQGEDGVWLITIKLLEFCSPRVTLAKPEGAKAAVLDPYDQRLEELTKQFQKLAGS